MKKLNLIFNFLDQRFLLAVLLLNVGMLFSNSAVAQCAAGEADIQIDLLTDNFGSETSWELRAGAAVLASLPQGGQPSATLVSYNNCVPCDQNATAYTFEIFDSFGDGICCGFGIGNYDVYEDGNLVATGGAFGASEATDFGTTCAAGGGGGGQLPPIPCQIACPADMTVTTDPFSACNAYVDIEQVEITGNCDVNTIVNDYNGTVDASDTYELGTTTVCFDVIDLTGNVITCCFDVTVIDNTAPVFTSCPGDLTFNLDAGECEKQITFDIRAEDECNTQDFALNQNTGVDDLCTDGTFLQALVCQLFVNVDISYGRLFDFEALNLNTEFVLQSIDLSYAATAGAFFTLNVYALPYGITVPNNANLGAPIYTEQITPPASAAFTCANMPLAMEVGIPVGMNPFVSVTGAGSAFGGMVFPGDITNPEDAPTYAKDCIFPDWVNLGAQGFPQKLGLQLNGVTLDPEVPNTPDLGNQFASGDAFPISEIDPVTGDPIPVCLKYLAVDLEGNQAECEFCVTVLEYAGQTSSLACNDHVNISLDEFCEKLVGADDILEGGPYGCYDDYIVNLFYGPGLTNPVPSSPLLTAQEIGETLVVQVIDPEHPQNQSCWGTISVEDKIIPALECGDFDIACNDSGIPGSDYTAQGINATELPGVASQDNATVTGSGPVVDFPGAAIVDIDVAIETDHSWVGDLQISITSPSGTTVELLDNWNNAGICGGCAGNGLDVVFDDESANTQGDLGNTCNNLPAADGDFQPKGSLSDFDGEDPNGNWTLTVGDVCGGDAGTVTATLIINSSSTQQVPFPLPAGAFITPQDIADGSPYTVLNFDPCGPVTLSYEDSSVDGDCVNDDFITRVTRTWTATDQSGNNTSCDDHYEVRRSTIADVVFPENLDGIDNPYLSCVNANTDPSNTGYPQINGQDIASGGPCEFAVQYEDDIFPICEGTYKIVRTWTVLAWCPTTTIANHIQIIKVVDDQGPSITCPANMTISTGQNDCTASVILPLPIVSDACSDNTSLSVEASSGLLVHNSNGTYTLFGLELGIHTVTYSATDACGNESECTFQILVQDQVNPVAICESFHTVGLTVDEPTLVPALVFDDGSYDNCELVEYKVRRMDNPNCAGNDATPYGDYVPFYCCDVGGPNVMVELRVRDAAGNTNSCMVEVEVQDKLNPAILCPADKVLDCYEDPYNLDLTGEATGSDNCSVVITHVDQGGLDNCGEGTIFRIWTATDPGGRTASCVQRIDVINSDPFEICDTECWTVPASPSCAQNFTGHTFADDVEWPCDVELTTCGPGLSPDELELNNQVHPFDVRPRITEDGCDLVAVTYEDLYLPITAPGCVKVLRTWIVIDWCQYNQNTLAGYWTYEQIIKVLESAAPDILSTCEDKAFCSFDEFCQVGPAELILEAEDDCTADEDLNYYYWIHLENNPNVIHSTGSDASGNYPLGTHHIIWHVEDGCGNVSICEYDFIIEDCKKPTPNLLNGIATELMENCQIEVWAVDWDNPSSPSFDNCGIAEWRVATPSQGPGQTFPPAGAQASITFNESHLGTTTVDVWIKDVNGNWSYVSTYILVQDNTAPFCNGPSASISGSIDNEDGEAVDNVTVDIDGTAPGMPSPDVTGTTGGYGFPGLANDHNYVVTPEKDVDPLNGVTTYDLVLISKHILGIENLDSPYKMIAADINASGSISTIDMVQLRKMILFIDTEFQSNTSWRFVDAEFVFPNANNPFATSFPEIFSINGLNSAEIADFVGVKTGDVNGSAIANIAAGGDDRNTVGDLVFNINDVEMVAGEQYTVDFEAKDFANILGYQFTLAFDKDAVEFVDVEAGKLADLSANNFGMSLLEEGVITTSWNATQATSLENADVVFSVTFTAKSNTLLSEALAVNSRYTVAEGYDNNADVLNIGLIFNNSTVVAGNFDLYQNQPNPFKAETVIGFNLPEAGAATLTVYDVSGKVLKLVNGDFAQGYNEVTLNRAELSGAGVLYYQLDTETDSATKKMIVID